MTEVVGKTRPNKPISTKDYTPYSDNLQTIYESEKYSAIYQKVNYFPNKS